MPWVVWRAEFARKQGQLTVKFSRGAAPRTPCMKTRVSLYHIKVLHLFSNRLIDEALGLNKKLDADEGNQLTINFISTWQAKLPSRWLEELG